MKQIDVYRKLNQNQGFADSLLRHSEVWQTTLNRLPFNVPFSLQHKGVHPISVHFYPTIDVR